MRAESVSIADCLLWKWEVFQFQVPVVPELLTRPFRVTAGIRKVPAVLLGSVSCLLTESSAPPAQCIKCVIFPQCCLHVCVCDVLPDPRVAFLPSLCLHSVKCAFWYA